MMSSTEKSFIDGADIQYGEGLYMRCHAVEDLNNPTPINLLDYYSYNEAQAIAYGVSVEATKRLLGWRQQEEKVDNALPLENADLVYGYVADTLGMEPIGKLYYVEKRPDIKHSGVTYHTLRKSFVIRDHIHQVFDPIVFANFPKPTDDRPGAMFSHEHLSDFYNNLRVDNVAAHELTHLAGSQDRLFFTFNDTRTRKLGRISIAGSTLQDWPDTSKGKYIEEGLAALVGNMYTWHRNLDIATSAGTSPYKSPSGTMIHMPDRIGLIARNEQTPCAWGIERLVDAIPEVWNILMASRKYNCGWMSARTALRACMESSQPGLFDKIDTVDIDSLDEIFEATARIDHAAKQKER